MRRLAMVVAVCVMGSSWTLAAPFDQLSDRLKQYDDQSNVAEQTGTRRYANPPDQGPFNPGGDPYDDGGGWDEGPCCGDSCGVPCGPPCGFYGRAEYVLWWVRGANTPPLVTTSPTGTPSAEAGVLPGANILFGNERVNNQSRSGGRFTLGYWLGDAGLWSLEDTFFFVGNGSDTFQATSDGSPILARPFFNTLTNAQDSVLVAFPNSVVGTIKVAATQQLYGNEINLRRAIYWDDFRRVDVLAGYRFLYLNEGLQVDTFTTSIATGGTVPVGTTFSVFDSFSTRNNFNGGQLGLNAEFLDGRWSLNLRGKIALGNVSQRVNIDRRHDHDRAVDRSGHELRRYPGPELEQRTIQPKPIRSVARIRRRPAIPAHAAVEVDRWLHGHGPDQRRAARRPGGYQLESEPVPAAERHGHVAGLHLSQYQLADSRSQRRRRV